MLIICRTYNNLFLRVCTCLAGIQGIFKKISQKNDKVTAVDSAILGNIYISGVSDIILLCLLCVVVQNHVGGTVFTEGYRCIVRHLFFVLVQVKLKPGIIMCIQIILHYRNVMMHIMCGTTGIVDSCLKPFILQSLELKLVILLLQIQNFILIQYQFGYYVID